MGITQWLQKGAAACMTIALIGCGGQYADSTEKEVQAAGSLQAGDWRYATDPYGSQAKTVSSQLVDNGIAAMDFIRIPRVDAKRNSWVEMIYDFPAGSLGDTTALRVTYQSSANLVIKFSQKDYGAEGDGSYAHYQTTVPASDDWRTETVTLEQFSRPSWTPASSVDKGIVANHINAIYFVPDLDDANGGSASIHIKNLVLLKK